MVQSTTSTGVSKSTRPAKPDPEFSCPLAADRPPHLENRAGAARTGNPERSTYGPRPGAPASNRPASAGPPAQGLLPSRWAISTRSLASMSPSPSKSKYGR